jgi:phosphoadenosine phosphosulfate reductase
VKRYTIDGEIDLVKIAIERLRSFEEFALEMNSAGYYVAYSGGKDSDVIRILCELSGVKYELWHNHTTVDAPETVRYIRGIVPKENITMPEMSMWKLIVKKGIPPTRAVRYCCQVLKEGGGRDRFVITGVRRSESNMRSDRNVLEIKSGKKSNRKIFMDDNDEARRMFETCQSKGNRTLNPIVEWEKHDVWEFLEHYGCESNPLYQCGYDRIGCVGCPMAGNFRKKQFNDYPKYKESYIKSFEKMLLKRFENGIETKLWGSGEEVFDWWISDKSMDYELDGQIDLFENEDSV